jgi:hypothetical protein
MREDSEQFDDPGLRAAVRRAVGSESAPPSLRTKVAGLIAPAVDAVADGPRASHAAPRRRLVINSGVWRLTGAAACVLLAVGYVAYQVRMQFFPPSPYQAFRERANQPVIPASIVLDVLRRHDACAKLPDHHLIPGDKPELLKETLTQSAGVTASATSLDAGWQFRGAGVCDVGATKAAHLLFARGDDTVSIFSMPATAECGGGWPGCYRDTVEKHPVAGFHRGGALYCIVGSDPKGEFTATELNSIVEKVQASVAMGCMSRDTMLAAAQASHRD